MFIGHFAVGLALKRVAPRTSLGWCIAAPQFLDLLWPCFLLLGWETVRIDPGNTPVTPLAFDSYPISHSLVMACVWGLAVAGLYATRSRGAAAALWLAAAVLSHWILDWITHRPDLPLAPWPSPKVGLGLWYSVPATVLVEAAMYAIGTWLYVRTTRAADRVGRWSFVAFIGLLAVIYVGNLTGPPPPDARSVALVTLALWLFPFWAAWFDRHRVPVLAPEPQSIGAARTE